jgi:hypothetical protein
MVNNYPVTIATLDGNEESCVIELSRGVSTEIRIKSEHFGEMFFTDENLFDALKQLRLQLEKDGYFLLCNAARKDAYPSRMALEMGGGRKIYLLTLGAQTKRDDLVGVLESASIDQVCTVAAQWDSYQAWLRSLE